MCLPVSSYRVGKCSVRLPPEVWKVHLAVRMLSRLPTLRGHAAANFTKGVSHVPFRSSHRRWTRPGLDTDDGRGRASLRENPPSAPPSAHHLWSGDPVISRLE